MPQQTILIIEDDPAIVDALSYSLQAEGFEVLTAADGESGLQRARAALPDLVVLDLMLPKMDGLQICREIKGNDATRHVRVLMLTAKAEETDEIVGFRLGADDYVSKPYKQKALVQRIKALLRREDEQVRDAQELVSLGGLEIDRRTHVAKMDGEELVLTPTEFKLLWSFLRQPERTYTRAELMQSCRGEDANSMERTIDVHIRSLRQKLGDKSAAIETVRGVGYRFRLTPEAPAS